jgi:hypothetical protein
MAQDGGIDLGMAFLDGTSVPLGKPGYLHDFPGLALESVHWLVDRGIGVFSVEAISSALEGKRTSRRTPPAPIAASRIWTASATSIGSWDASASAASATL